MTRRAIGIGLFGAVLLCGVSYLNDWVLHQTHLVGNSLPVSVYGTLILFLLLVNSRLGRWALAGKELAVILALVLASCCVPGSNFLRTFTSSLVMPHHHNRVRPAWQEAGVLDAVPSRLMPDVTEDPDTVVDGFVQGLGVGSSHAPVSAVPWRAWLVPFACWLPMILCMWFAIAGLALVIHTQWARHEHLPYPLAAFTDALLPKPGGEETHVLHHRLFWIGFSVILAICLNNYLATWFPDLLIPVATRFDLGPLASLSSFFDQGGARWLLNFRLYFTVVAISFFIPADLSGAFGFGPVLWAVVLGALLTLGINPNAPVEGASWSGVRPTAFLQFGAALGIFLALIFTGRHYYRHVFLRAAGVPCEAEDVPDSAVWGCRLFLVMTAAFVVQLAAIGLSWQLAVLYTGILLLFYVVTTRVVAESGLFHVKLAFFPCVIVWGLIGSRALGSRQILLMQLVTMVLFVDPRETLMPFLANSLKVLDLHQERLVKACRLSLVAIVLGLSVALPVTLYLQYDRGSAGGDRWAYDQVATVPFASNVEVRRWLKAQGVLESAESRSGWGHFLHVTPSGACVAAAAAGLALVVACAWARLRFSWWPLHPLIFVIAAATHINHFALSFIIGWVIKLAVDRYGGAGVHHRLKPLMFGLIAGEVTGALLPNVIGVVLYLATGEPPPQFRIFPG